MANTVYNNKVIEARLNDLLATSLNTRSLMTIDNSLTQSAGMIRTINRYDYTGVAEELAEGEDNTGVGSLNHTPYDYEVKRVQHTFEYTDDEFYRDNTVVDNGVKGANITMTNKMTADFFAECAKATKSHSAATIGYEAIVDAIAELKLENESKLFVVIPQSWLADIRKDEDYKSARYGEVVYNGMVATVAGIPVIASKAATEGYVMTKEAVNLIMKKDVEVEQSRDIGKKKNKVVLSTYYICALVDASQICKITKA